MQIIKKLLVFIVVGLLINLKGQVMVKASSDLVKVGYLPYENFVLGDNVEHNLGYAQDLFNELNNYTNQEYELILGTDDTLREKLANREIDLLLLGRKEQYNSAKYDFSNTNLAYSKGVILTKHYTDVCFMEYPLIEQMNYGYVDQNIANYFRKYLQDNNLEVKNGFQYPNIQELRTALANDEIDFIICEALNYQDNFKQIDSFNLSPLHVVSLKNNVSLTKFNQGLAELLIDDPLFLSTLNLNYYGYLTKENTQLTRAEKQLMQEDKVYEVLIYSDEYFLAHQEEEQVKGIIYNMFQKVADISTLKFTYRIVNEIPIEQLNANQILIKLAPEQKDNQDDLLPYHWFLGYDNATAFDYNIPQTIAIAKDQKELKEYLSVNYPKWHLIEYTTSEDRIDELMRGNVSGIIISKFESKYYQQNPRYQSLKVLENPIYSTQLKINYSLVSNPNLQTIIHKALNKITFMERKMLVSTSYDQYQYAKNIQNILYENKLPLVTLIVGIISLLALFIYYNHRLLKQRNELEKQRNMANKANQIKSDFMARMSHDMRTPLAAVIGLADLAISETKDQEDLNYFKQIKDSSEYLLELMNDVLDTQKLSTNTVFFQNTIFEVNQMLHKVSTIVFKRAKEKNISLNFNFLTSQQYVLADERRISQILINLLNNSIKYSYNDSVVSLTVTSKDLVNQVELTITIIDHGVGMSCEFQNKMFEPFAKEENCLSNMEGGSGLGLSITAKLVEALNGSISCQSKLEQGTTFIIQLPLKKVSNYSEKPQIITKHKNYLQGKKILVCEDIEVNAKIIKKILEKQGIEVYEARNGKIGYELFLKHQFDLLLLDIRMPVMDGLALARLVREKSRVIPIIALSANAYVEDIEKSLAAGMNQHLSKPINQDKLLAALLQLIK